MPTVIPIRPLTAADGPALARLAAQCPDTGRISFTSRYHLDPFQVLQSLQPGTSGFVAEDPTSGDLVGSSLVAVSRRRVAGQWRDCALLTGLMVHPAYRRQGLAARLTEAYVTNIRDRFGDEAVMLANIQHNNAASLATVGKWCRQIIGPFIITYLPLRPTSMPPTRLDLRPARLPDELDEIAAYLKTFYQAYHFYPAITPATLADWLTASPFAEPLRRYWVAADRTGSLWAGLAVTEKARLTTFQLHHMPPALRLANRLLRLVPAEGVLREIVVEHLWARPGHEAAAQALLTGIRRQGYESANVLRLAFDPRSPLADLLRLPPWLPRGRALVALRAPAPVAETGLIYPYQLL